MESFTFRINDDYFELSKDVIPCNSLLHTMITTKINVDKDEKGNFILHCDKDDFVSIYNYLKHGKIPLYNELKAFDYFNIDMNHSSDRKF
jgi:hypothetical protein